MSARYYARKKEHERAQRNAAAAARYVAATERAPEAEPELRCAALSCTKPATAGGWCAKHALHWSESNGELRPVTAEDMDAELRQELRDALAAGADYWAALTAAVERDDPTEINAGIAKVRNALQGLAVWNELRVKP